MADKLDLDQILEFAKDTARKLIQDGQKRRMQENASQDQKVNSVDFAADTSIGEETYDGQKITDDPTWIAAWRAALAKHQPDRRHDKLRQAGRRRRVQPLPEPDVLCRRGPGCVRRQHQAPAHEEGSERPRRGSVSSPSHRRANISVAVEYGSSRRDPAMSNKLNSFKKLTSDKKDGGKMVHSLRSVGSAALNICMVAAGDIDV
ncbi:hypothetical protein A1Q1_04557 [Trichosporon asahii var. asahii CBS 2479]|uniref:Uncharacterized protein n=1 Tax=Trichosporon asahii var. asahii (strain ATCC 90039 / CBS 2479 / JCM 2466 / KCTC 7840 / NBRC 103889/ NCYC 2677 / UAMH 7654) TaxID=1186058 RepID=J5TRE8_TRIAS|nr:hypothetical protein A1Q1_04557 [Trichosporon asahii var. asahii CBS 2479]EJT52346.1 hypothetical protein A1Q1_04557 [Trichosporon asahii var. asahii CBS 2479]